MSHLLSLLPPPSFASPPSGPSFGALANQATPSFGNLAQQGSGFGSQPNSFSGFGQQPQAGGKTISGSNHSPVITFKTSGCSAALGGPVEEQRAHMHGGDGGDKNNLE